MNSQCIFFITTLCKEYTSRQGNEAFHATRSYSDCSTVAAKECKERDNVTRIIYYYAQAVVQSSRAAKRKTRKGSDENVYGKACCLAKGKHYQKAPEDVADWKWETRALSKLRK